VHESQIDLRLAVHFRQGAFGIFFYTTSSKSLPIVDRRRIGLKFCGNFGSLPGFLPRRWKMRQPKAVIKEMCEVNQWPSWKAPAAFVRNAINSQAFLNFRK
jgi:hypothetical protein